MPTITFSFKDLQNLVGKNLSLKELEKLSNNAKGDFKGYDKESDEIKIDFGDTNLPYLWSVEGFARFIKGMIGIEKGIPTIKINDSEFIINVDSTVTPVRPFISAFVAKGHSIDENILKQFIQLQEKLSENYGKKREKIAIGLYPYQKISFPITYKAVKPDSVSFIPLDFLVPMKLREILETHPKGRTYARILEGKEAYPILIDSKNDVLSFPPIINSERTGKLNVGDRDIFFEATGTDLNSVLLVTSIFSQAMYERGFKIFSVHIKYTDKLLTTPQIKKESVRIDKLSISSLLGIELNDSKLKSLLESARYDFQNNKAIIPHYRADIMHKVDIIEDIGIAFGYDNIPEKNLERYTIGSALKITEFIDKIREMVVGLGYNEVMSPILSNKELLYIKMNINDFGTVEIETYMSETYSAVRTWILPILMECLSKNKHVVRPHRIFEEGIVAVRKGDEIIEYERIGIISSHEKADFTEVKQILDYLLRQCNIGYSIEEVEHGSFIQGRCGRVIIKNKMIGYIGEIHPQVLSNFGIETPTSGLELNLSDILDSL